MILSPIIFLSLWGSLIFMGKIRKELKLQLYIRGYKNIYLPTVQTFRQKIEAIEKFLTKEEIAQCLERVDYYCKSSITPDVVTSRKIKDLKKVDSPKAYYFDLYEYARFFDQDLALNYVFGDVIEVPQSPSIVKSRPIGLDNENSVLINLDKQRHFRWAEDDLAFEQKQNLLICRNSVYQPHRFAFFEKYFNHPLCDLGQVNTDYGGKEEWVKAKIAIPEHFKYKFILCLEGFDVASNLKWVMSSNSVAVMPKPKYETWFMEGTLQAGVHYIEIKPDYSDLEQQLNFYIAHPEECQKIIEKAHQYCAQFWNKNAEDYCSLKVLEKYLNV